MAGSVEENDLYLPVPPADLAMIIEAIRLVVTSGKGYGEVVITFKRGQVEMVEPKPQFMPERSR